MASFGLKDISILDNWDERIQCSIVSSEKYLICNHKKIALKISKINYDYIFYDKYISFKYLRTTKIFLLKHMQLSNKTKNCILMMFFLQNWQVSAAGIIS